MVMRTVQGLHDRTCPHKCSAKASFVTTPCCALHTPALLRSFRHLCHSGLSAPFLLLPHLLATAVVCFCC
jgi:hypothetical protein